MGMGRAERLVLLDHAAEHLAYTLGTRHERAGLRLAEIITSDGGVEPMEGLLQFAIGVGQFAEKMSGVPSLGPRFSNVGADAA
jgi:hypothetical protein